MELKAKLEEIETDIGELEARIMEVRGKLPNRADHEDTATRLRFKQLKNRLHIARQALRLRRHQQ